MFMTLVLVGGSSEAFGQNAPAIQRLIANDCVHAFLYQPQWVTVARKGLTGLWKDMPVLINDLSALAWA